MKHFFSTKFLRPPWWLPVSQLTLLVFRLALAVLLGSDYFGFAPSAQAQYIYRPTPYTYLFNTNATAAATVAWDGQLVMRLPSRHTTP